MESNYNNIAKKIIGCICILILYNCDVKDCLEPEGNIIQQEVTVDNFTKIKVGDEITLIIEQGTEQKIIIETSENLLDNIVARVNNDELFLEDETSCNFTREFALTKVIVTSPNITEIRGDTSRKIMSKGTLTFPSLTLISEDFAEGDALNIADFELTIDNQSFTVVSNGNSVFKINGATTNLNVGFFGGIGRFEGRDLIANNVQITHKSTNDILVNPQNSVEGTIFNLGNVISYHQPPIVNVDELYTGSLIFN